MDSGDNILGEYRQRNSLAARQIGDTLTLHIRFSGASFDMNQCDNPEVLVDLGVHAANLYLANSECKPEDTILGKMDFNSPVAATLGLKMEALSSRLQMNPRVFASQKETLS